MTGPLKRCSSGETSFFRYSYIRILHVFLFGKSSRIVAIGCITAKLCSVVYSIYSLVDIDVRWMRFEINAFKVCR